MKALFVTILVFAVAFCAYDYFGAPVGQKVIFKSLNVPEQLGDAPAPAAPAPKPADAATPAATEPGKDAPAPAAAETTPPPAPAPSAPPPVQDPTAMATPKFASIESLTKNWTFIPKTAFPRQVVLKKALPFKMSVGSSTINAGTTVTAIGFDQGVLTLAPTPTSSARASAAIEDTDLKPLLVEGYEAWKVARTEVLKKAHEQRLANKSSGLNDAPAPAGDPSQAPTRGSDGSYPLLVSHLNSGEVNEIKAKNVHRWGDPEASQFEGKPAWAVKIQFDAETVFGLQPAEAQAIISGGRVKGWFYTGTGEPVP